MDSDDIRLTIGIPIAIILFVGIILIGFQFVHVNFIDNIPSVVKVDGKVVYEGTSAGFDLESSGANTTVTIRGGFLYFFPRAYYTSKDVQVIGRK